MLVSANDAVTPVLGYGFDHQVPDSITNESVKGWFDGYARQIDTAFVLNLQQDASVSKWDDILENRFQNLPGNAVAPLLTTTWDQGWPYNAMCPADPNGPGGHVWAGCVATAMAQILKYHNYPDQGLGSYGYQVPWLLNYPYTSANFGTTTYNWINMPNSISEVNNDVATIIYHTAVSCSSVWGSGATGVQFLTTEDPMSFAFINFFKMAFNTIRFIERQDFIESTWDSILMTELIQNRPVYYRGDGVGSHAFVCDGIDGGNMYHFNWGWSGMFNGYYLLSNLTPGAFNFNNDQMAIVGLMPNDGSTLVTDSTWTGNVVFDKSIVIPVPVNILVNPGTNIKFAQNCKLQVYGKLTSIGTQSELIKYTALDTTVGWQGIKLDNNYLAGRVKADSADISTLIYSQVEYSKMHGIDCRRGEILIDHCKINNNEAVGPGDRKWGGFNFAGAGIAVLGFPIKITQCEIYNNHAVGEGGGISFWQMDSLSSAGYPNEISYNDIHNNSSESFGGGLSFLVADNIKVMGNSLKYNNSFNGSGLATNLSSIKIVNNSFINNSASGWVGGTLALYYESKISVFNNLISNNNSHGISCYRSSPFLLNNTIVNNAGSGIWFFYNEVQNVDVKNCILFGNIPNQINIETSSTAPFFDHCDIEGGLAGFGGDGAGANYNAANYTNNLDIDPHFVNPSAGVGSSFNGLTCNWSLPSDSPCLDSGDTTGVSNLLPAQDLDSNSRINRILDIGAYESTDSLTPAPVVIVNPMTRQACEGANVLLYAVIRGDSLQYEWFHNSTPVPSSNNDSLFINNASFADSGYFFCVGCNGHGCDTTAFAHLEILQVQPLEIGEIEGPDTVTWWEQPVVNGIPFYLPSIFYCVNSQLYSTYTWNFFGKNSSASNCKAFMAGDSDSSGFIKVKASNICGTVDSAQKYVVIKPFSPPEPYGVLYGPFVVYKGEILTYHFDIGNFYIEKIFHLPVGFTNNWTDWYGYANYTVNVDTISHTVIETYWRKTGTNHYYEGEHIFLPISIVDSASQLPGILGPDSVSLLAGQVNYSIDSLIPATSYEWILPDGLVPIGNTNGRSINVSITSNFIGDTLRVRGINPNWRGPYYEKIISFDPNILPIQLNLTSDTVITNGNQTCFNASQTITVAGGGTTFQVQPGGSATMIAGEKILYLPGTTVESGGYLHGYIAPQGPWCITPAVPSVAAGSDLPPVKIERTSFNLYPNPTTGRFVVEFSGDIPNGQCFIDIYDMQGEKIMTHTINGDRRKEFSLSGKPVGVYLIRIITRDWAETVKIIKN